MRRQSSLLDLAQARAPLSISPWTELAVGYGVPPVAAMAAAGVRMGLSSDNVVLAGQIDMFAVMRVAADLAAGMAETQQVVDDATILPWATRDGALALGLKDVGTLEMGKRADLQMIDARSLNLRGASDPVTAIVRAARPADLRMVLIDGIPRKQDGQVLGFDLARTSALGCRQNRPPSRGSCDLTIAALLRISFTFPRTLPWSIAFLAARA